MTFVGTGIEVTTGGEDVIRTTEDVMDTTDGVTVMEGVGLTAGIVARGSEYTQQSTYLSTIVLSVL